MNFLFVVNDLNISSSGDITIYHRKATWLGPLNRVVKQFLVSILSHLTNPFCRIQKGALKKYFISIYTQSSFDDLLFDGKDGRYFDKIQDVYRLHDIKKSNLIDIGCGDATFYYWLKSIRSIPITYLGIDVAHPSQTINNSAKIVNLDVIDYSLKNKSIQPSLLMMSNSICYMDDDRFNFILKNSSDGTETLIIEPIPSLFWDAHFSGVKLYYRNVPEIILRLQTYDWVVCNICIDYMIYNTYISKIPLSACIYAKKS
jgi:hypothetical protein